MTRRQALDIIGCHSSTIKRYVERGWIRVTKLPNGRWNYYEDDVYKMVGKRLSREHWTVLYTRVDSTSTKNKEKMEKQKRIAYEWSAKRGLIFDKVYEDYRPASDYNRPALLELIEDILKKRVDNVVVETRCRLTRFAWGVFALMFKYHGVALIVMNKYITDPHYQTEQADDITRILQEAGVQRLAETK
jgi:predicted site-specific integrase-resolvase